MQNRLHTPECKSTNTLADDLIRDRSFLIQKHGLYITTDFQTAGRGHGRNSWHSNRSCNLLMSLIINKPDIAPDLQFHLSRMVALALQQCVSIVLPKPHIVEIKWPNDLLVNHKKIAGILIENKIAGSRILQSIIGIGLNINEDQFPSSLTNATSFLMETGKAHAPDEIRWLLHECLQRSANDLITGFDKIHQLYDEHLYMKGVESRFTGQFGPISGTITGTTTEGLLVIKTSSEELKFGYKEVVYPGW
ncbi:MAG TPA: biotin--[acetyl-CoA-carboxylase] ligase [Bacteroidales bacterium]|nr:biotin--[acetyl-CoA-carboxylase] ligase [Bacteroidales bacterium]HRZ49554.1 biotin--[acetyl-CoA-carboxylase] ligase [Bacteroidales bacterium]